ncbi:sugar ABC transporter substrate-binding protein [Sinorhizobium sp. 8-89]|uniref:ABC transporter substrate-binding protein n=1 Tax=Sinorhizobium sp. 7-81 TaxID=3049087 RepID=UPI0024C4399E|nr:sugar ABC transporter substrate-binding protein [Sinorhizobium sp. 7-81]MDK1389663.1 sugar ABC transporter substrate-binding protein [Sinorhizobium sp. 7-81]
MRIISTMGMVLAMTLGAATVVHAEEITWPGYMWQDPEDVPFYGAFADDFEKANPDIQIKRVPVPYSGFFDKQFTDLASGNPADIVTMFDGELGTYIENGFLEPLNPYLDKAGISLDDFGPSARLAVRDGKIYGVNIIVNPVVLLYHSKLLEQAGVQPPKDISEYYEALKKLNQPEKHQFATNIFAKPGAANLQYNSVQTYVRGFGVDFFEKGKPTADKPETIEALRFYKKIYDENLTPKGMDINGAAQLFYQGKIAMEPIASFAGKLVGKISPELGPQLRAMALPFPGHATKALSVFVGIGKDSKNKDAAGKMVAFIATLQEQQKILDLIGQPPARLDIDYTATLSKYPWFQAYIDAAHDPKTKSIAPEGAESFAAEVQKVVGANVEAMLFSGVSPEDTAAKMQKELLALVASKKKN